MPTYGHLTAFLITWKETPNLWTEEFATFTGIAHPPWTEAGASASHWTKEQRQDVNAYIDELYGKSTVKARIALSSRGNAATSDGRKLIQDWWNTHYKSWAVSSTLHKIARDLKVLPINQMRDQGTRKVRWFNVPFVVPRCPSLMDFYFCSQVC